MIDDCDDEHITACVTTVLSCISVKNDKIMNLIKKKIFIIHVSHAWKCMMEIEIFTGDSRSCLMLILLLY